MRTIDLQKFCSEDETHGPLMKPWREGEFTYASDGRVVLRVPAELKDAANTAAPTAERMAPYFDPFAAAGIAWQKLPSVAVGKTHDCAVCHGEMNHECSCGSVHGGGKRCAEGAVNKMNEPIVGCCSVCGASGGGGHHPDCWLGDIQTPPPPVYDLAEFERQLEGQQACAKVRGEFYMEALLKNVVDALKASKREAK